jgi:hypothetical protein
MVYVSFGHLTAFATTVSICKVGDCGLQTYQTVTILKRAKTAEFTTITPILYIHCCMLVFIVQSQTVLSFYKSNILS